MPYQMEKSGLVTVLRIPTGFMSEREIHRMRGEVRASLADGNDKLIVDLGVATHLNSMILGAFVEIHTTYTKGGGEVLFAEPTSHISDMLETLRIDQVFDIVPTLDAAVARLDPNASSKSA